MRRSAPFRPEAPVVAEIASGAVVFEPEPGDLLLLHEREEDRWTLPKGHVEPGESLRAAALREVREETGLERVTLLDEVAEVHYRFFDPGRRTNVAKTVVYFRARSERAGVSLEAIFDTFAWVELREALRRLPYPADRLAVVRAESVRNY